MKQRHDFEWDEEKNQTNAKKHGISFERARAIWNDPSHYRVRLCTDPEERWLVVGQVHRSVYVSAIITYRGDAIRIISARRSTQKERDRYHGKRNH